MFMRGAWADLFDNPISKSYNNIFFLSFRYSRMLY